MDPQTKKMIFIAVAVYLVLGFFSVLLQIGISFMAKSQRQDLENERGLAELDAMCAKYSIEDCSNKTVTTLKGTTGQCYWSSKKSRCTAVGR